MNTNKIIDSVLDDIRKAPEGLTFTPPEITDIQIDSILDTINRIATSFLIKSNGNSHKPSKKKKMKEKKPAAEASNHETLPEHNLLRDALQAWTEEAPEEETRSAIVIQVSKKDGELSANTYVNGNPENLIQAIVGCTCNQLKENHPISKILFMSAIKSLVELGVIEPTDPETGAREQQQSQPNNNDTK